MSYNPYNYTGQSPYNQQPTMTGVKPLSDPPYIVGQVQTAKKTQEQIDIEAQFIKKLKQHQFNEKEQAIMINLIIDKKPPMQVLQSSNMNMLEMVGMWGKFKALANDTGITQDQLKQIANKLGIPI